MRNKTGIIILTVIITVLCLFYLSFTLKSRSIRNDAEEFATDYQSGVVDLEERQAYLDSIYNEVVYSPLGLVDYTYKEVQERELNLGLDLQGGMHVTLEVSPREILEALAGRKSQRPEFQQALDAAEEMQQTSQDPYLTLFHRALEDAAPDRRLASYFASSTNREYIKPTSTDEEVIEYLEGEVNSAISRTFEIIRTRIDRFGVTSPNLQRVPGSGRIQVELPGADNPERVRNLLQGVAKLEFLEVHSGQQLQEVLVRINDYLLRKEKQQGQQEAVTPDTTEDTEESDDDDLFMEDEQAEDTTADAEDTAEAAADTTDATDAAAQQSQFFNLANQNYRGMLAYNIEDTAKINDMLNDPQLQALLPGNLSFLWGRADDNDVVPLYAVKKGPALDAPLTGESVSDARMGISEQGGQYEVVMYMNPHGTHVWKQLTENNRGQQIAISLDNTIYSAPVVQSVISNGISSITGDFTQEEAEDLANVLKAGKLPASPRIVEEGIIGPSLGQQSINSGLISTVSGLLLVVLFMVLYYSKGGFVADFALLFNIFFILGILAQLGAALTLPGIAGIVLTMGMSVDANVLIYERIREELRSGKSVNQAIKDGYNKAFSAIFDANITTILIGVVLAWLGTGPVQGFATTLIIGIATSFFTAVFITRIIIEWLAKKGKLSTSSFESGISRGLFKNISFDFIRSRKKAYLLSIGLIVIGFIGIIASGGLNLGVDFKGGRSYTVQFNQPINPTEVREALADNFENQGMEVKTYGANNTLRITTSYLIENESTEADSVVRASLVEGLSDFSEYEPGIIGQTKVGATIADDIRDSSILAVVVALIAIFLYVFLRFRRWQFGLGALLALAHDVLICIAIFGLVSLLGLNLEVDQIFIAALLTVIGYSVNDTVVVFDRIRENMNKNPKAPLADVMNTAISETMSRTIITAVTLFIVVIILFIFGGEVLKGFSLILILGTIFGTYSSIYIATPVVLDLGSKNKEGHLKQKEAAATT